MSNRDHSLYSTRQRVVVITFATVEEAERWDAAGQPLNDIWLYDSSFDGAAWYPKPGQLSFTKDN
jgi:hypothetical protein